jgi:predicted XRE-type DNA-binding protein
MQKLRWKIMTKICNTISTKVSNATVKEQYQISSLFHITQSTAAVIIFPIVREESQKIVDHMIYVGITTKMSQQPSATYLMFSNI